MSFSNLQCAFGDYRFIFSPVLRQAALTGPSTWLVPDSTLRLQAQGSAGQLSHWQAPEGGGMVQLPSVPVLTQRRRERACYYDESPPTSRFLRPRRDPTRYPVPATSSNLSAFRQSALP